MCITDKADSKDNFFNTLYQNKESDENFSGTFVAGVAPSIHVQSRGPNDLLHPLSNGNPERVASTTTTATTTAIPAQQSKMGYSVGKGAGTWTAPPPPSTTTTNSPRSYLAADSGLLRKDVLSSHTAQPQTPIQSSKQPFNATKQAAPKRNEDTFLPTLKTTARAFYGGQGTYHTPTNQSPSPPPPPPNVKMDNFATLAITSNKGHATPAPTTFTTTRAALTDSVAHNNPTTHSPPPPPPPTTGVKLDNVDILQGPSLKSHAGPSLPISQTTTIKPGHNDTRTISLLSPQIPTPPSPPPLPPSTKTAYIAKKEEQRDMPYRMIDHRELFMTFPYSTECNKVKKYLYSSS